MGFEARLAELTLALPPAPKPVGVYRPLIVVENLAYLSGYGPSQSDGSLLVGCGARRGPGSRLRGRPPDRPGDAGHPAPRPGKSGPRATRDQGVWDGQLRARFSATSGCDQWVQRVVCRGVWRGTGRGWLRSAIGVVSLPAGMTVEIEAVFEVLAESP